MEFKSVEDIENKIMEKSESTNDKTLKVLEEIIQ